MLSVSAPLSPLLLHCTAAAADDDDAIIIVGASSLGQLHVDPVAQANERVIVLN